MYNKHCRLWPETQRYATAQSFLNEACCYFIVRYLIAG